jgi:CRISPR-associated protein Cas2
MYVILVYDVNQKRVGRALKVCRRYLNWVQNSVFEGEITEAKLKALKLALKHVLDMKDDSVLIYRMREQRFMRREVMGQEKNPTDPFL